MPALEGVVVIQLAGLAPGPFAGMMLADLGAAVVRVDRRERVVPGAGDLPADVLGRGCESVGIDLKHARGAEVVLRLVERADVFVEGFRPGVVERLGIGPEVCRGRNPGLVYGRMTGWGQTGPLASRAGHDINYLAVAGVLGSLGPPDAPPPPPLNLVADFGGGGMLLVAGILAALLERHRTGEGQVVDAAMVDGAALMMAAFYGLRSVGAWRTERGTNLLDGSAPFYRAYETSDGAYVAAGADEPAFYAELLDVLGLDAEALPAQRDRRGWADTTAHVEARIKSRTRAAWEEAADGRDACLSPVLDMDEASDHPHNRAREVFVDVGGVRQPGPAPRLSGTPRDAPRPAPAPGRDTDVVLERFGFAADELGELRDVGAIA